ncbi:MAG: HNH endonuclease signature motif containing protein [Geminicoccaceae bacterium]
MSLYSHLYNNNRWRRLRAAHLAAHPFCAMCRKQGRVTPATVADHVKPHRGDPTLFWDPANLASLCQTHHSAAKQREERTGITPGYDADGMPLDPEHRWAT